MLEESLSEYHSSVSQEMVRSMWSRKLIMMYSKRRSLREDTTGEEGGRREERRERIVIQASLSHSVIARESRERDFVERPARWGM